MSGEKGKVQSDVVNLAMITTFLGVLLPVLVFGSWFSSCAFHE